MSETATATPIGETTLNITATIKETHIELHGDLPVWASKGEPTWNGINLADHYSKEGDYWINKRLLRTVLTSVFKWATGRWVTKETLALFQYFRLDEGSCQLTISNSSLVGIEDSVRTLLLRLHAAISGHLDEKDRLHTLSRFQLEELVGTISKRLILNEGHTIEDLVALKLTERKCTGCLYWVGHSQLACTVNPLGQREGCKDYTPKGAPS